MTLFAPGELAADPHVVWIADVLRYADMDPNSHINNSTFSVLCESGRVNLFRTKLTPTLPPDRFFVVARLVIEFRSELHYPGRVRTGTWLTRVGRTSLGIGQIIMSGETIAATAEAVCVSMERATRRPAPLPEETRRVAEAMVRTSVEG
jgi:acyl-CoA thioester hydrolase